MKKLIVSILAAFVLASGAHAQSTCPSIVSNAVLTAAQWNSCFSAKQDALRFSPVNKAGDSMSGRLTLPPPTTVGSVRLTPGTTPGNPTDGDLWTTTSGLFAQINGTTVGPLGGGGGAVSTVFGRSGTVSAQTGDYGVAQVTGAAPLASPTFTGVPAAPTATGGTNTTQVATTAFVQAALASGGSVTSVFGRNGVVTAHTGDYAVAQITGAAPLLSPAFTGTPTAPTASPGTNTTQTATTAFVTTALGGYLTTSAATSTYAPLASAALTGTPTAPTAAPGTNTTQVATTAFVAAATATAVTAPTSSTLPVGFSGLMACGTTVADGATTAGANLSIPFYDTINNWTSPGATQTGTWMNISGKSCTTNSMTLFVRVS